MSEDIVKKFLALEGYKLTRLSNRTGTTLFVYLALEGYKLTRLSNFGI